ncbi:hypothetical protein [Williamsia sterculiae]|nr:hypothetical protein [Williamsia sterculiae]
MPDPAYAGQSINDAPTANHRAHHDSDTTQIARLCAALETATSTPADCYFAIWEGYHRVVSPLPGGARMRIPNRGYHLYQGPLSEAQRWTTHDDRRTAPELVNHPAFVWPADHAWCVACDTDPHWAGIGASEHTIGTLVARDDIDVVRAHRSGPFYT